MKGLLTTLFRRRKTSHPDDRQLLDQILAEQPSRSSTTASHIDRCISCNRRLQDIQSFLDSVTTVERAGFEELFTTSRLQNQRERIKRKLARVIGHAPPGQIVKFPSTSVPVRRQTGRTGPWRAAALGTAAGLFLGVVASQRAAFPLMTDSDQETPRATVQRVSSIGTDVDQAPSFDMTGTVELPPLVDGSTGPSLPQLTLEEFERAIADGDAGSALDFGQTSLAVAELESIDALTPRVRDLAQAAR